MNGKDTNRLDEETALLAEQFGAGVEWAVDPDEHHHIIKFTPPQLRAYLAEMYDKSKKIGA